MLTASLYNQRINPIETGYAGVICFLRKPVEEKKFFG